MLPEQQLRQIQAANASRGAAVLAIVMDGLRNIIGGARLGDPDSIAAVHNIAAAFRELDTLAQLLPPPAKD